MCFGIVLQLCKAEADQAVGMREDQRRDVPASDSVHQFKKPSACDLRSAARFFDEFDVRQTFRHDQHFQHVALVEHIGRLCSAGDATSVADARGWMRRLLQPQNLAYLRFSGVAAVPGGAIGRDHVPVTRPSPDGTVCVLCAAR